MDKTILENQVLIMQALLLLLSERNFDWKSKLIKQIEFTQARVEALK